jgi:ribosomal protein S17E
MKLIALILCFSLYFSKYTNTYISDVGNIDGFDKDIHTLQHDALYYEFVNNTCGAKIFDNVKTGLNAFDDLITNNKDYICNSDKITMIGDVVYINRPKFINWTNDNIVEGIISNRLLCGWTFFQQSLDEIANKCKISQDSIKDKVTVLLGNHSWDVSYKAEAMLMEKIINNEGYYIINNGSYTLSESIKQTADLLVNSPKFEIGYIEKKPIIIYLDIHIMGFICLFNKYVNDVTYEECRFKTRYSSIQTEIEAKEYLSRFIFALKNFKLLEVKLNIDRVNWRVLRLHHPLWNIEGNKQTQSYFWTYRLKQNDTYDNLGIGKTLLELMREASITFILSGHHHSSQIIGFPYNSNYYEKLNLCKGRVNQPNMACIYNYGLFDESSNEMIKHSIDNKEKCENSKINSMVYEIRDSKPNTIFNLISGNGNKFLDKLENDGDNNTSGALMWARAIESGGMRLEIRDDSNILDIIFFEKYEKMIKNTFRMTFKIVNNDINCKSKYIDKQISEYVYKKIEQKKCGKTIPKHLKRKK